LGEDLVASVNSVANYFRPQSAFAFA